MKSALAGTLVAGAMALSIVLGGCAGQQPTAPAPSEPVAQEQAAETTAPQDTSKNESAAIEEQTVTRAPAPTEQQASQISGDEAKRIALTDAGATEQDTTDLKVELDTDDGVTKYEVDFNVGQTEYDYDIDPVTGAILERSAEIDD